MANLDLPRQSWIIIDTNFLIDFYSKQKGFVETVSLFKEQENTLTSIDLVRCEFIRSKTKDVVQSKSEFFAELVESLLPLDTEVMKLVLLQIVSDEPIHTGLLLRLSKIIQQYPS